jgi:hypothetical protein
VTPFECEFMSAAHTKSISVTHASCGFSHTLSPGGLNKNLINQSLKGHFANPAVSQYGGLARQDCGIASSEIYLFFNALEETVARRITLNAPAIPRVAPIADGCRETGQI